MEKIEITLAFDGEKLDALEYALRKERTTVQKQMDRRMGTIETDRFESVNSPPWISGMVAFAKRGILFLIAFGEGIFQGTRGIVCLSQVERNKRRITKWISREAENYRSGSVWTR